MTQQLFDTEFIKILDTNVYALISVIRCQFSVVSIIIFLIIFRQTYIYPELNSFIHEKN